MRVKHSPEDSRLSSSYTFGHFKIPMTQTAGSNKKLHHYKFLMEVSSFFSLVLVRGENKLKSYRVGEKKNDSSKSILTFYQNIVLISNLNFVLFVSARMLY